MADKITTLKEEMTGNDVYPNVKEANIPDTMSKQFEFTSGIKSPKIIDSTGYNIVKGDTSYVEVGNGSRILKLNGTASRPTYNGLDLALTTDIQRIYTAGDGISIDGDILSIANQVSKEVTFNNGAVVKDHIKTPQVANLNGGALVRYKDTENTSVFGGSGSKCTLMGSADRPTYSKDGADFNGKPLALSTDLDSINTSIKSLEQSAEHAVTTSNVAQTIDGAKTFSKPIKGVAFSNTDGKAMVAYNETTETINIGNSDLPIALKGSAERPPYNGNDLALKSDIVLPPVDTTTDGFKMLTASVAQGIPTYQWVDMKNIFKLKATLADNTWDMIQLGLRIGNPMGWAVGDTKDLTLTNGDTYSVRIVDMQEGRYESTDGTKCMATFEFVQLLKDTTRAMNYTQKTYGGVTNYTAGGWLNSDIRTYIKTEVEQLIPDELSSVMLTNKVGSASYGGSGQTDTKAGGVIIYSDGDKLFLASQSEISKSIKYCYNTETNLYPLFDYYNEHTSWSDMKKAQLNNTSNIYYWLRSLSYEYSVSFNYTMNTGQPGGGSANVEYGVPLYFTL